MAARGYRISGANGSRGASWCQQLHGKELRGGTERILVFWTPSTRPGYPSPSTTVWCVDSKVEPLYCCNVPGNTLVPHMTLKVFCNPCVAFPALDADVVCLGRTVSENSCIRGRCLFREGCLRKLVQLVICGECLTGDVSITYDRLFA